MNTVTTFIKSGGANMAHVLWWSKKTFFLYALGNPTGSSNSSRALTVLKIHDLSTNNLRGLRDHGKLFSKPDYKWERMN